MQRLRVLFPWVGLVVCGVGFVGSQWVDVKYASAWGHVERVQLSAGTLELQLRVAEVPIQFFIPARWTFRWRSENPWISWGSYGYTAWHGNDWHHTFAGFVYFNDWTGLGLMIIGVPLWFPALLAGLWLMRRRFKRRGRLKGFEVLPAGAGKGEGKD